MNLIHIPPQRTKHFSFLIQRNNIFSIGWNDSYRTHPIAKRFGYRFNSIHSELASLLNANTIDFSRFYLINLRLNNTLELQNSKPCEVCEKLLVHYGVTKVVYSTGENTCPIKKILI